MSRSTSSVEMSITELRRSGDGSYEEGERVFRFSGAEHSSAQNAIELHLKANIVRKEIPGGNKVVHQMMAATWQPFTIEGEWDDKWGNRRTPSLGGVLRTGSYAYFMMQEFSSMVSMTPIVRFELDAISIVGVISDFKVRYERMSKIGWSVTLSPETHESIAVIPPRVDTSQPIQKWIEDNQILVDDINSMFENAKNLPLKTQRVEGLTGYLLAINDAMDRLNSLGTKDFNNDTVNQLLLMATTFRRLRAASLNLAMAVSQITSPVDVAYDDVLLSMEHAEWIGQSHYRAIRIVGVSKLAERDMRQRAGKKPRAIYRPKAGESLERISLRFYGTANAWRLIYDANNLSSLVLDGTEELIIPEKRS